MKKKRAEVLSGDLYVVEDYIKTLSTLPKGYVLNPTGMPRAIAVDHKLETVYINDSEFIESVVEKANNGDDAELELEESTLEVYTPELYAVIGFVDKNGDGNCEAELQGIASSKELAEKQGAKLIKDNVIEYYEIQKMALDDF